VQSITFIILICSFLLLFSAVWVLVTLKKRDLSIDFTSKSLPNSQKIVIAFSALLYFALVSYQAMPFAVASKQYLQFSIGSAIAVVGLVYLCIGLYFYSRKGLHGLSVILIALTALCCLGLLSTESSFSLSKNGWALYFHLVLSLCSYACLSVAALLTVIAPWQSRRIRKNPIKATGFFPSIEALDFQTFRLILIGFCLLTIALISGFFFLENLSTQHLPHKVILSLLSWLVFGILLLGRWKLGWRGKTAMRFALLGFFLLLLAYFGSKWVLEVILNRSWN